MGTAIVIVIIVVICVFAIYSYGHKMRHGGGCCGSHEAAEKKVKVADKNKDHYPYAVTLTIDGMKHTNVTFPYTTKIRRGFDETVVKIESPNYTAEPIIINKSFNAVSVINLLDILGWGIDAATGAITKPEFKFYQIDFQPKETTAPNQK